MNGRRLRIRTIVAFAMGLAIAWLSVNLLFPRIRNQQRCEDSVPENPAQSAALMDARARKAAACRSSEAGCLFEIFANDDGTIQIRLDFGRTDFFDGCVFEGSDHEELMYGREGEFIRVVEGPYGRQ